MNGMRMDEIHITLKRRELTGEGVYLAWVDDEGNGIRKLRLGRNIEEALRDLGRSLDRADIELEIS